MSPHPVLLRPRLRTAVLSVAVAVLVVAVTSPALASDPARSRQWALDVIGADAAQRVGEGAGAVIAIVDTGVDLDHEDLDSVLVAGRDFVEDDDTPQDEDGHGTHVAGIAAAVGDNGRGVRGVAPAARIMPVRVLDEDGSGTSADVNAGIRWAADNGADVINLSLAQAGQQVFGPGFTEAVNYAWSRGVVVVVAAGNEFVLSSGFGDEPALVVSATTREDRKPDYSNGVGNAMWGMAAPGGGCQLLSCPTEDGVFSTWWDDGESDVYAYLSGTSMAAPHVAGAAAVLRSLGLGPRETVDRLLATAEDIGASGRDSTFGAGRLDLAAAVDGLGTTRTGPSPNPSPSTVPEPEPTEAPPTSAGTSGSEQAAPPASEAPAPDPSEAPPEASPSPSPTAPGPTPSPPPAVPPSPSAAPSSVAAAPEGDDRTGERGGGVLAVLAAVLLAGAGGAVLAARRASR